MEIDMPIHIYFFFFLPHIDCWDFGINYKQLKLYTMIYPCSCAETNVLAYFSYTSIVQDELMEFRDKQDVHKNRTNPNLRLKNLYEEILKAAENKYHNKSLRDNKCVLLFEYEGREFFIGYYDGVYTLGLCCYVICGNVIDFKDKAFGIRHSTCITNGTFNNYADVMKMFEEEEL